MSDDSKKPQNGGKKKPDSAGNIFVGLMATAALGLGAALILGPRAEFGTRAQREGANKQPQTPKPSNNKPDGLTELSKQPKKGPFGK